MALTTTEEALVRQLLDQQAAILSLAGNESTITSKLGATKVTLADLVAASSVADADLLLTRQGTTDKSVRADILAAYMTSELNLSSFATQVQLAQHAHHDATQTQRGFMSAADKQRLDGLNLAPYAPLLNPLFTKRDSDLNGGAISLQAADNQGFGDLTIGYYGANNYINISAPRKSGGGRHGLYIDLSRVGLDEWPELLPPAGSILITAANFTPAGYLTANGAAVSRTAYAKLFTNIGTRFGAGDGSTTFNLPDLRGEFIRGWDNGRGADPGRALGSWQDSQNRWHHHSGTTYASGEHSHSVPYTQRKVSNTSTGDVMMVGNINSVATSDAGNHDHNFTTSGEGGNEARPRNVALMMCIKY